MRQWCRIVKRVFLRPLTAPNLAWGVKRRRSCCNLRGESRARLGMLLLWVLMLA